MEEIKTTLNARDKDSQTYDEGIKWAEGMKMRYVQACIKEALRFHPPLGQMLLRNVPKGGTTICNRFIPEGIVVGCNAWTVHRDKSFYGEDADHYRPERWLDSSPEHIQKMENLTLAFGGGPRVCIGKNIALLEITKTVPELFRRFEIKLVDPKEFMFASGWLTPQRGLNVYLKRRDQSEWSGA
jgi:cytochrome P450